MKRKTIEDILKKAMVGIQRIRIDNMGGSHGDYPKELEKELDSTTVVMSALWAILEGPSHLAGEGTSVAVWNKLRDELKALPVAELERLLIEAGILSKDPPTKRENGQSGD